MKISRGSFFIFSGDRRRKWRKWLFLFFPGPLTLCCCWCCCCCCCRLRDDFFFNDMFWGEHPPIKTLKDVFLWNKAATLYAGYTAGCDNLGHRKKKTNMSLKKGLFQ